MERNQLSKRAGIFNCKHFEACCRYVFLFSNIVSIDDKSIIQCTTINGTTIVNGFDGCLELMAHTGDVQVQLNSIHNFPADFHQLQSTHPSSTTTSSAVTSDTSTEEEDSKPSTIIAQSGKILCIVDPEMSTWLSAETMVAKKSAITIHSKNFDYHSTEPEVRGYCRHICIV